MKKRYRQPTIKAYNLTPRTSMLTPSYGEGIEVTGTEEEPGGEEDFV